MMNLRLCDRCLVSGLTRPRAAAQRGISGIEFAIAIPVMLLLGLAIWQWAIIMQARQIIDFAVREGARSGSLQHAEPVAIERGLISGLAPLWVGNADLANPAGAPRASTSKFVFAEQSGWVAWRQLSPTRDSFADWGTSNPSAVPGAVAGEPEIPIDNLAWRARQPSATPGTATPSDRAAASLEPVAGVSQSAGMSPPSERIGSRSGQTLREAGILRIELTVGVPLVVPLAGRFISWAASLASNCPPGNPPKLGTLRLDSPGHQALQSNHAPESGATAPACAMFSGPDEQGRPLPRLPVRAVAEARMQSAARQSSRTPGVPPGAQTSSASGVGDHLPIASRPALAMVSADAAGGDNPNESAHGHPDRQPGFLQIGGEREIWAPGSCGISPS
jgi:Flp pilus assembly protein TadG